MTDTTDILEDLKWLSISVGVELGSEDMSLVLDAMDEIERLRTLVDLWVPKATTSSGSLSLPTPPEAD